MARKRQEPEAAREAPVPTSRIRFTDGREGRHARFGDAVTPGVYRVGRSSEDRRVAVEIVEAGLAEFLPDETTAPSATSGASASTEGDQP